MISREELLTQLRAMPSSLNDAMRTMEMAADFITRHAQRLPTPEQIEPILDDFLGVDCPHYEELRKRCAQRIVDLYAVASTERGGAKWDPPGHELCWSCGRLFKLGETCTRGGCPCGGDV